MKEQKTNVMRILEQRKIAYTPHAYPHGDAPVDGAAVAELLGAEPERVFKTLVAVGASGGHYVFDIPVTRELDLKKASKAVGEKHVALVRVSELNALTGYVRGGCSPVGMKKPFPTVFDASALAWESIYVSAGKIGAQVELAPAALIALVRAKTAEITDEHADCSAHGDIK